MSSRRDRPAGAPGTACRACARFGRPARPLRRCSRRPLRSRRRCGARRRRRTGRPWSGPAPPSRRPSRSWRDTGPARSRRRDPPTTTGRGRHGPAPGSARSPCPARPASSRPPRARPRCGRTRRRPCQAGPTNLERGRAVMLSPILCSSCLENCGARRGIDDAGEVQHRARQSAGGRPDIARLFAHRIHGVGSCLPTFHSVRAWRFRGPSGHCSLGRPASCRGRTSRIIWSKGEGAGGGG